MFDGTSQLLNNEQTDMFDGTSKLLNNEQTDMFDGTDAFLLHSFFKCMLRNIGVECSLQGVLRDV